MAAFRRTGADLPFGDPGRAHGVAMEGYYWRLTGNGRVIVALSGVCRDAQGSWANLALAVHPGRRLFTAVEPLAEADRAGLGVTAGEALRGDREGLRMALDGARLAMTLAEPVTWPRRAWGPLGPAHWVPAIGQYWFPYLLGARASGALMLGDERIELAGMRVYAEKNWGTSFPTRWWWGEAHDFPGGEVTVAFAGGSLRAGLSATAIIVRLGDRVLRLGAPTALVRARVDPRRWRLHARTVRHDVVVEGVARGQPFVLPVPLPAERRTVDRAHQHPAGEVTVTVREGRRLVFRGLSPAAGLEYGAADAGDVTDPAG